jgi:hypothetical protein
MGGSLMKTISRYLFGVLFVLGGLAMIETSVRADDDYVKEINRYIENIYKEKQARDDYLNGIAEAAMKLRDDRWIQDAPPASPSPVRRPAPPVGGVILQLIKDPVPLPPGRFPRIIQ